VRGRGRAIVVVTAVALVTGACGGEDPGTPDPGGGPDGWRRIGVPGTVRSVARASDLLVAGEQGGRPTLGVVRDGAYTALHVVDGPRDGVRSVDTNGESVVLSERTDVAAGEPATLWSAAWFGDDVLYADWTRERLADRQGRPASWLQPLLDGEEDYRAIGAVRRGAVWSLHGWMAFDGWKPLDRGEQLYTRAAPATLLTGTTETTVVVAGEVSGSARTPPGPPQVWSLDDSLAVDASSPGRWVRRPMASVPDALTDVASWDLGWWVAGHRDLRPVVYDYDRIGGPAGAELPVPDTKLDPEHPTVVVAGAPVTTAMVLATQSADGVAAWVDEGKGRWTRIPGPPGVLSAAVLMWDGRGLYLVVDGDLWYRRVSVRELPEPIPATP
jgi:hypothetical protein